MAKQPPVHYPSPDSLTWGEPPASRAAVQGARQQHFAAIREALMARPGEWAIVAMRPNDKLAGHNVRPYLDEQFEVVSRKVDGEMRVYARYMPKQ